MKGWKCGNCGHMHEASETLAELGFQWLGKATCKTSCQNCWSYTIQQAYSFDVQGRPAAGQFLVVTTKNKIRKGW